ncbi:hypothetical protein THRCLA_06406 [Thraustotheca clavata]|uniref:Uncharacterized protein n=1 Tax=Thraustotheca clavata TaxID=74557 RepID=A0A1V9ZP59_9STRA|nr:hypothetical protein THRCLA_06406 [Thraustotheca clavata]
MAGKGKRSKKTMPPPEDTASDSSSIEPTIESDPTIEEPVLEETNEPSRGEETTQVGGGTEETHEDITVHDNVEKEDDEKVVEDERVVEEERAMDENVMGMSFEERVLSDETPRSPRHEQCLTVAVEEKNPNGLWYLHPSYYYQKTKDVYLYTTSFRGVATMAHVGESSVNFLLKQLNLKQVATLQDVDQTLAPALETIDEQLEERVAGVLQTLVHGQEYILAKKELVVECAKEVQSATLEKVAVVKSTATDKVNLTVDTVSKVKTTALESATSTIDLVSTTVEKTRESVNHVTTTAIDTVTKAKNTALDTLTATANTFLSYVPILNKKVMA